MLLEGWEERTTSGGLSISPDLSLVPLSRADVGRFENYWHAYPNPECWDRLFGLWCNFKGCHKQNSQQARCSLSELIQASTCRLVVLAIIYLTEGFGGVTAEISWQPAEGSREAKTEKLKPWLSPRRMTYIIIDPARSGEYGHPSGAALSAGRRHASPVPHARRGHWRRLSPERRSWIRPAWVGATEWKHEGRTYRMLV